MRITNIISTIIVALTVIAGASAWSMQYSGYGPGLSLTSGQGTASFNDGGWGNYGVTFNNGQVWGGYAARDRSGKTNTASFGYADGSMTNLYVNSNGVRANVYRTPSMTGYGSYAGSVGFGSRVSTAPYVRSNYYSSSGYNYYGNSLY